MIERPGSADGRFSKAAAVTASVLTVLAIGGCRDRGCQPQGGGFCRNNEPIICDIGHEGEPAGELPQGRCSGDNPACVPIIGGGAFAGGSADCATSVRCPQGEQSCRGAMHVRCVGGRKPEYGLDAHPGYEQITDCSKSVADAGTPYVCSLDSHWGCADPTVSRR